MRKWIANNWRIAALAALGSVAAAGPAAASAIRVPEPGTVVLFATGVAALIVLRRRRK